MGNQNKGNGTNSNANNNPKPNTNSSDRARDITKGVAKTVQQISKAAIGVIDLIRLIKQHPEWYTHYSTSNLIALNLASKQNVIYDALSYAKGYEQTVGTRITHSVRMPAIARVGVQLTVPRGDQEGWATGMRLLWQQLRTANAGRVNYSVFQLERYVLNVRNLKAVNEWLYRLYTLTYTFRSTNSSIPYDMMRVMGVDPEDVTANAADLFMYQQRFAEQMKVNFPLQCDLFNRTEWMFHSAFVDSDSQKPSFYIPTINPRSNVDKASSGSAMVGGLTMWGVTDPTAINSLWLTATADPSNGQTVLWKWSDIQEAAQAIKNVVLNDDTAAIIAGDIIKAFGDKAFSEWSIAKIDEGLCCIYDENALAQWQNATVMFKGGAASKLGYASGFMYYDLAFANNFANGTLIEVTQQATPSKAFEIQYAGYNISTTGSQNIPSAALQIVRDRTNKYLVNWHANSIDAGHTMSATRLVVSQMATSAKVDSLTNYTSYTYGIFGTEVVMDVTAIVRGMSTLGSEYDVYPLAGRLILTNPFVSSSESDNQTLYDNNLNKYAMSMFLWANFDWAPRLTVFNAKINVVASTTMHDYRITDVSPDILDWDVFALIDYENLANYYSYGNQSLVYVGPSQNQSNRSVYGKGEKGKASDPNKGKKGSKGKNKSDNKTPETSKVDGSDKK